MTVINYLYYAFLTSVVFWIAYLASMRVWQGAA
jgi:hypothetical protein